MSPDLYPYEFHPEQFPGYYRRLRAAIQFLTDNYWKRIGSTEIQVIVVPRNIEDHFLSAVKHALSGVENALESSPEDEELQKLPRIFRDALKHMGEPESILVSLIHGEEMALLQLRLGDSHAVGVFDELKFTLDELLESGDRRLIPRLIAHYKRYHEYVGALVEAYDEKLKIYDEDNGYGLTSQRPPRLMSELIARQQLKLDTLWMVGVLHEEEWV